jgi:hypothetical protein
MEIKESAKDGVGCDCFSYYMFTSKCYTNTIKNMRNNEISWCAQNMNIVLNSSLNTIGKAYVILQRVSESHIDLLLMFTSPLHYWNFNW